MMNEEFREVLPLLLVAVNILTLIIVYFKSKR